MMTKELADQVRSEVQRFKAVQDDFLQTYKQLCAHHGGPGWRGKEAETVFHQVRRDIIPIMENAGMDDRAVQALCSWAEWRVLNG